MNKKIYILLLLIASLGYVAKAQTFTAKTSKSKVVVGEQFQITFTLNSSGNNFDPPDLTYFKVYSGPNQSTSTSYVNGAMTQSVSLSYIISAKKDGKYSIGAASVKVNGKSLRSNSLNIDVVKAAKKTKQQIAESAANNLFLKTVVNKTNVFQGEQITVIHKVYTRYQLRGFKNITFPNYNGFWSEDDETNQQVQLNNETINGISYQVGELKRTYIFPQRSGKLKIGSMEVECVIRKKTGRQPRDVFEQFFGGGYEDAVVTVKTAPTTINVKALPTDNKPKSFSGAVGKYSFKAKLTKDQVMANDAVNLKLTISGKGNLKLLSPPKVDFPEDFETYDPKLKENIKVGANGVSGSKSFDYLLIPRHEGEYKIEKLDFSYFDPQKKKYITIAAPKFNLKVNKGTNEPASSNMVSHRNKEEVKMLGRDIRYINTNSLQLKPKNKYFFGSPLFYLATFTPFLAFMGFFFFRKKHIKNNKDTVSLKSKKAKKIAKKRLSVAEQHLKTNNKEQFYIEILNALYGYLGDKLNIATADISKEHIANLLKGKSVSEATIQQVVSTVDNCEYARYAPSAISGNLNTTYSDTVELIMKIENEIK